MFTVSEGSLDRVLVGSITVEEAVDCLGVCFPSSSFVSKTSPSTSQFCVAVAEGISKFDMICNGSLWIAKAERQMGIGKCKVFKLYTYSRPKMAKKLQDKGQKLTELK
jgi:hypothetical protein